MTQNNSLALRVSELGISTAEDLPISMETLESGFLPYLKFCSSNSDEAKSGEVPVNHYVIKVDDKFIDFGKEPIVMVFGQRQKAVDMSGENVIVSFDPTSSVYKSIAEGAGFKTKKMAGFEFLLYFPEFKRWATFHLTSTSAQYHAPRFSTLYAMWIREETPLPLGRLTSKFIKTKKFEWFAPTINETTEVPPCVPSLDDVVAKRDKFNHPKSSDVTVDEDTAEEPRDR